MMHFPILGFEDGFKDTFKLKMKILKPVVPFNLTILSFREKFSLKTCI